MCICFTGRWRSGGRVGGGILGVGLLGEYFFYSHLRSIMLWHKNKIL